MIHLCPFCHKRVKDGDQIVSIGKPVIAEKTSGPIIEYAVMESLEGEQIVHNECLQQKLNTPKIETKEVITEQPKLTSKINVSDVENVLKAMNVKVSNTKIRKFLMKHQSVQNIDELISLFLKERQKFN